MGSSPEGAVSRGRACLTIRVSHSKGTGSNGAPARDPLATVRAYHIHGTELFREGQAAKAASRWERALEALDDVRGKVPCEEVSALEAPLRANLAQAFLELGRFRAARDQASGALRLVPECVKSKYRLAEACAGLGEYAEAERQLTELHDAGHTIVARRGRAIVLSRRREARMAERKLAARMFGSIVEPSSRDRLAFQDDTTACVAPAARPVALHGTPDVNAATMESADANRSLALGTPPPSAVLDSSNLEELD
mmetsp:Transcript_13387/g.35974  ORF Transcript_13387/g.35974 Transcript_13387/m.35974 type:complete len:254 (-) Transcript_13387:207-968(-)